MTSQNGKAAAISVRGKPTLGSLCCCICLMLLLPSCLFSAERLTIAVATNFIPAFKALEQSFEKEYAVAIDATYTSSGNLFAQIVHGAPYDLFLSADEARPAKLFKMGLAERPFVYARGRVVLWGRHKDLCSASDWKTALRLATIERVSIANPQTAPYGASSLTALQAADLWTDIQSKLVFAQTVAQAFQYANSGAVAAGFCAYSSVYSGGGRDGCLLPVNQAPDIIQAACVLRRTQFPKASRGLAAFLASREANRIMQAHGYQ